MSGWPHLWACGEATHHGGSADETEPLAPWLESEKGGGEHGPTIPIKDMSPMTRNPPVDPTS